MSPEAVSMGSLEGTRVLDGRAEYVVPPGEHAYVNEDSFAMALRLDGSWYQFAEDPDDGYRSGMRQIVKVTADDFPPGSVAEFAPITVEVRVIEDATFRTQPGDYEEGVELIVVTDERTGRAICEVGTRNTNDYYPSFVHRWDPNGFDLDVLTPKDATP